MACRTLELTLISAEGLKNVNIFSNMKVYAVATIAADHGTQQRTPTNRDGGQNPSWNATLRFPIPADPIATDHLIIHVLLRSERALGDRDVGEVHIPFKELLEGSKDRSKFVSYQVRRRSSGKAKGVLNLSYKVIDLPASTAPAAKPAEAVNAYPPPAPEKQKKGEGPVMAYPAATGSSGSSYPPAGGYEPYPPQGGYAAYPAAPQAGPYPPQGGYAAYPAAPQAGYGYGAGHGYGAPPPQAGYGYGAPPPQAGYGYGAPAAAGGYGYGGVPPKRKNNFGMGLGAGLLGGAIGGMLIGDMVSDAADYDAGYDAGFDDGFGF